MNKLQAFQIGMQEYRSNVTTHFGPDLIEFYDAGRDKAHELTNREFDDSTPKNIRNEIIFCIEEAKPEKEFRIVAKSKNSVFDIVTMPYTKSIYDAITQFGKLLRTKPVDVLHALDNDIPLRTDYVKKAIDTQWS